MSPYQQDESRYAYSTGDPLLASPGIPYLGTDLAVHEQLKPAFLQALPLLSCLIL